LQFGKIIKTILFSAAAALLFFGCGEDKTTISSLPRNSTPIFTENPTSDMVSAPSASRSKIVVRHEKIYALSLHYPDKPQHPYPVILFIPGWGSVHYEDYQTLIDFLVRQGNIVLFAPEYANEYGTKKMRQAFDNMYRLSSMRAYMDITRLGVVGHSSGGGKAFDVYRYFREKGWGQNGSFIFAMAPWFAFDMGSKDLQSLPPDMYVMIELFGNDQTTDPRIPMTIYSLLTGIPADHKTFYIYPDVGHNYPTGEGNASKIKGVVEPLKALMHTAFKDRNASFATYDKLGSDAPWQTYRHMIAPSQNYPSKCRPNSAKIAKALAAYDIDYCGVFVQN